ncbi:MAG: hypothetical protein RBJ76_21205 [Stenomitos frigidus ULC029]
MGCKTDLKAEIVCVRSRPTVVSAIAHAQLSNKLLTALLWTHLVPSTDLKHQLTLKAL